MSTHNTKNHNPIIREETGPPELLGPLPAPRLEYEDYRAQLAEFELTEAQENELLEILWDMMRTTVDIGFGLDAVQMVIPAFMKSALGHDVIEPNIESGFNMEAQKGDHE